MIRETLQCVKQVGDVLPVKEGIKIADIFVEEKNDDNKFCPTVGCFWMEKNKGQIIMNPESDKRVVKKVL